MQVTDGATAGRAEQKRQNAVYAARSSGDQHAATEPEGELEVLLIGFIDRGGVLREQSQNDRLRPFPAGVLLVGKLPFIVRAVTILSDDDFIVHVHNHFLQHQNLSRRICKTKMFQDGCFGVAIVFQLFQDALFDIIAFLEEVLAELAAMTVHCTKSNGPS
jgi:hypothetical protein